MNTAKRKKKKRALHSPAGSLVAPQTSCQWGSAVSRSRIVKDENLGFFPPNLHIGCPCNSQSCSSYSILHADWLDWLIYSWGIELQDNVDPHAALCGSVLHNSCFDELFQSRNIKLDRITVFAEETSRQRRCNLHSSWLMGCKYEAARTELQPLCYHVWWMSDNS